MASANASIPPDDVQVWDIGLVELERFGSTAAAAVDWARDGLTPAQRDVLTEVWSFAADLLKDWVGLGFGPPFAELHDFLAGPPGRPTGFEVYGVSASSPDWWSVEFAVGDDVRPREDNRVLRWRVTLGMHRDRFVEFTITQEIGGEPLTVRVHPSRSAGHDLSPVWSMRTARGPARKAERARLHAIDAREPGPIVFVSYEWDPRRLAESVIGQLIDWYYRVASTDRLHRPNCPRPRGDALEWWITRLTRITKNQEIGLPEAVQIAARSVRPATPAGHHAYWRKSLRPRGATQLDQACALADVSRATAYGRLKEAGRQQSEFASVNELADFLIAQAPNWRLSDDARATVDALMEAGMKTEAARKLERRTRKLPEVERAERLMRAIRKRQP